MVRSKIVFKDGFCEKRVFGIVSFENGLVKVDTDMGNTIYIKRANIVFIKELTGG
jgi:hypothetical protein